MREEDCGEGKQEGDCGERGEGRRLWGREAGRGLWGKGCRERDEGAAGGDYRVVNKGDFAHLGRSESILPRVKGLCR